MAFIVAFVVAFTVMLARTVHLGSACELHAAAPIGGVGAGRGSEDEGATPP